MLTYLVFCMSCVFGYGLSTLWQRPYKASFFPRRYDTTVAVSGPFWRRPAQIAKVNSVSDTITRRI